MNPLDLIRLTKRHRREPMRYIEADHCVTCRESWPCDVIKILEIIRKQQEVIDWQITNVSDQRDLHP